MFSEIAELKTIREQKAKLSEREVELSKPKLTDLARIASLYEWFKEIVAGRDCASRAESVVQRKKFILIVLSLYSPGTLAGDKMVSGVRKKLSEVFGLGAASAISDNVASALFFYHRYPDFHREVDGIYTELVERLKEESGAGGEPVVPDLGETCLPEACSDARSTVRSERGGV